MGRIRVVGDITKKEYQLVEESTGVFKVKNVSDARDYITADSTTITDASGVRLSSHGSRHARGGADAIDYSLVMKLLLKSVSPTLGTGGALGSAVSISPDSGYTRIVPYGVRITIGGTIATGETITVRVTFARDDATSAYIDKSYTATGSYYLSEDDLIALWKNGVGVTSISVQAGSSASTTSATVTLAVRGVQH
jgi:hypothetical protein